MEKKSFECVCEKKLESMIKKDNLTWGEAVQAIF
jgi:hypothetical protein